MLHFTERHRPPLAAALERDLWRLDGDYANALLLLADPEWNHQVADQQDRLPATHHCEAFEFDMDMIGFAGRRRFGTRWLRRSRSITLDRQEQIRPFAERWLERRLSIVG